MTANTAPYGSWTSPITAARLTQTGIGLEQVAVTDDAIYWMEARPLEAGRNVVVRRTGTGSITDVTPAGFNARTRVHEYGGGAYWVHQGVVYFTNFADQRLYRHAPGDAPEAITPEPPASAALRYADGRVTPDGRWIICVRERHETGHEAMNELIALPADGSGAARVVASGHDFYASPRLSPDGQRLAWLVWDHPRMPWDGTELWVATLGADGGLSGERQVAGGAEESIFQPEWSPDGVLHFVSDRTGWWNLYARHGTDITALAPMEAEFGSPQWVFGLSTCTFLSDGRIACVYTHNGEHHLGIIHPGSGRAAPLALPYSAFGRGGALRSDGQDRLVSVVASPLQSPAVACVHAATGEVEVVKTSVTERVETSYLSAPEPIAFPTENGLTAYALFYPPHNADFAAPPDTKPPLVVMSHGGPTSATSSQLALGIQYWTSRGFAVVDVNYGGSTGYGRAYRERLKGNWGIVDTADCINAARYLQREGRVDGARMAIRGGSAGGYTTLSALVFHNVFAAGASLYGVADLEALAQDTHKFESRYLDSLVGPYPEAQDIYRQRSPIHYADRISCPVIILQGLEDRVVPPSQAEVMVEALQTKQLPFAYLTFEGEQHGFRKAENIERALEAEYYFYAKIFGFEPADEIEPVAIENL